MKVTLTDKLDVDLKSIQNAISSKEVVDIYMYSITREVEDFINNLLVYLLNVTDQQQLMSYLSYSALELLSNASKANSKRIYFQEKGLDIFNANDYANGMLTFSTDLGVNKKHFMELVEKEDLYIKLSIQADENIKISVSNKAKLTEAEYKRINDKFERAKVYKSMEEALTDIDKTEGSGLGIIIIVLMLKQIGLDRDNLIFESENGITTFSISIPLNGVAPLDPIDSLEPVDPVDLDSLEEI